MAFNWNSTGRRIKVVVRRERLVLLSFAIPATILLIGFFTRGVYPIANRDVLTIDLFHQYAPFMAQLQHKLKTGGSLLFSWTGGTGVNFYSLFSYYLASPLNLLVVFFSATHLTEAIMLLIVLKIGLAGACFHIFLKGVYREDNLLMVAVSALYALSSFSLAYYWNIMWLDGVFLLPLILLGLVQLVRDGRFLLYTITLGLVIFSNYYIAFFVCIFTALYFIVTLFQYKSLARPGPFFAAIGRVLLFTLLGAGLAAVLALPTYFSLQLTSAAGDKTPTDWINLHDLFDYIQQHYLLTPPTIRSGMPNLYAGVGLLLWLPMFFLTKTVPLKEKFLKLALFFVLLISFNVNILDFFWHGMHFPNQLPYRNSFVYIFLVLSMAYPALASLKTFNGRQIGGLALAAAASVLLAQKLNHEPPAWLTVYLTLAFIAIYAAVMTLDRVRKLNQKDMAAFILFVVVVELIVNTLVTLHTIDTTESMSSREGYLAGTQVREIKEELKFIEREEVGGFYRVEVVPPKTINDPFMYNYRGVSIFASTMQTKPVRFFERLGFHSNSINSYKYEASTLLLDSLFGVKYLIRRSGEQVYDWQSLVAAGEQVSVYQNPYALSFGLVGTKRLLDWKGNAGDPFATQNSLFRALTNQRDVLKSLELDAGDLTNMTFTNSGRNRFSFTKTDPMAEATACIRIENDADQPVYLYWDASPNQAKYGYVMIGETKIEFNARRSTVVDLGQVPADQPVELTVTFEEDSPENGRFEIYAATIDRDIFEAGISHLQSNSLQVERFEDTFVSGRLDLAEDGVLLLMTPFDTGWTIRVDGEITPYKPLDDGLIVLEVPQGTHELQMRYRPPWLISGLLISLSSALILLAIAFFVRQKRQEDITGQVRPVVIPDLAECDDD